MAGIEVDSKCGGMGRIASVGRRRRKKKKKERVK